MPPLLSAADFFYASPAALTVQILPRPSESCWQSLVLNLSAWRIRVIIAYLHVVGPGVGPDPGVVDKSGDKNQCQLFIGNALKV